MREQMLDLDGHVVADVGMPRRQALDHAARMCRAVEEIRVAERDVLRAGRDLLGDVGEHGLDRHDPHAALVDRHDRAVRAGMQAAARGLGVAREATLAADIEACVGRERWLRRTVRDGEREPGHLRAAQIALVTALPRRQGRQCRLGFDAQHMRRTVSPQPVGVQRSVQAEGDAGGIGALVTQARQHRAGQARRGMHGHVHRERRCGRDEARREWLARQVDEAGVEPRLSHPRRRQGRAECRPPQLVRGQNHDHCRECSSG